MLALAQLLVRQLSAYTESILCYFLFPWTFTNVAYSLRGQSLGHVAIAYGFLCSILIAGRILGRAIFKSVGNNNNCKGFFGNNGTSTEQPPLLSLLCLSIVLKGMACVTRYSILVMLYFCMGILAVKIGVFYEKNYGFKSSVSTQGIVRQIASSPSTSVSSVDIETELYMKMKIIAFIFTTLLSSLLYGHVEYSTESFPAYFACSWLSTLCFIVFLMNVLSNRTILQKIIRSWPIQKLSSTLSSSSSAQPLSLNHPSHAQSQTQTVHTPIRSVAIPRDHHPTIAPSQLEYDDGCSSVAPSIVTDEIRMVPNNFLLFFNNPALAKKAYKKTLKWRRQHKVDTILSTRQDHFGTILELYPHALHKYSLDGCAVVYELLGLAKPAEIKALGITPQQLVWHFVLRNELLFQKFLPMSVASGQGLAAGMDQEQGLGSEGSLGRMMTVLDVKGISIGDITTDVLAFIKQSGDIMDNHYPGRVARLVVCNAPTWFYSVWSLVARVLPESIRQKITIMHGVKGLDAFIDKSQRPVEYGGDDNTPLGQAPQHQAFLQLPRLWDEADSDRDRANAASRSHGQGLGTGLATGPGGGSRDHPGVKQSLLSHQSNHQSNPRVSSSPRNKQLSTLSTHGISIPIHTAIDISHPPTAKTRNASPSSPSSSSSGLFGWIRGGNHQSSGQPQQAYLGEKNSFRFDPVTATWKSDDDTGEPEIGSNVHQGQGLGQGLGLEKGRGCLDDNDDDEEEQNDRGSRGKNRERGSYNEVYEDGRDEREEDEGRGGGWPLRDGSTLPQGQGLGGNADDDPRNSDDDTLHHHHHHHHDPFVLRDSNSGDDGDGNGSALDVISSSPVSSSHPMDFHHRSSPSTPSSASAIKMSPHVFLLVISMYFLSCLVESGIFLMLPIWLTSPRAKGGLGYSVVDIGLAISGGGVVLLMLVETSLRQRLSFVLRSSPLRATRIGCGAMVVCCLLLPNLLCSHGSSPSSHLTNLTAETATVVQGLSASSSLRGGLDKGGNNRGGNGNKGSLLDIHKININAVVRSPANSLLALVLPASLLATTVGAGQFSRKASGVLLHIALAPSFSTPTTVIVAVRSVAEVVGPLIMGLVFSAVHYMNLTYPMDCSFLLSLASCVNMLLYIGTLLLSLQYRGDFGLIADADETFERVALKSVQSNLLGGGGNNRPNNSTRRNNNHNHISTANAKDRRGRFDLTNAREALFIPARDLGMLFSSVSVGYGSKTFAVGGTSYASKVDLKDV